MAEDTLIVEEVEDAAVGQTAELATEATILSNTLASLSSDQMLFTTYDYVIFVIMLGMSALIGVYFGFVSKRKQDNTTEYLLGGKTMSKFPVSASLIAR
jgi:solute carrier family 5 (sodium-coupled monocarboxylate transporter), member 8/12